MITSNNSSNNESTTYEIKNYQRKSKEKESIDLLNNLSFSHQFIQKEKLNQNKRKHSSISSVFNELDINCLNNTTNYDLNSTVNNSAHSSIKLSYDEYDSLIQVIIYF